jgi:predicted enzyme related to lactoylglutathione lyase
VKLVTKAGGQVRAEARDFPDRGAQAIIADNEGSTIGLLQSSSGDSADGEPKPGDWNWFELFVKQPQVVAAFYRRSSTMTWRPTSAPSGKTIFCFRAAASPAPAWPRCPIARTPSPAGSASSAWRSIDEAVARDRQARRRSPGGPARRRLRKPFRHHRRFHRRHRRPGGVCGQRQPRQPPMKPISQNSPRLPLSGWPAVRIEQLRHGRLRGRGHRRLLRPAARSVVPRRSVDGWPPLVWRSRVRQRRVHHQLNVGIYIHPPTGSAVMSKNAVFWIRSAARRSS